MKNHDAQVSADSGQLLSIDDVAALLGVSRRTVYRLTWRGEISACRVGERLRYRRSAIETYLDRHEVRVGAVP
jgi:excisionase family DNA binding protein